MDVDELIVPQMHRNWTEMLDAVTSHEGDDVIGRANAISFRAVFVFRNVSKDGFLLDNQKRSAEVFNIGEM